MSLIAAIAFAASVSSSTSSDNEIGWKIQSIVDLLGNDDVYNMESRAEFPDRRSVNAQVILNGVGVEFHSLVRYCTPEFYDYRQDFVIQHNDDRERQLEKLERLASQVMDELQSRCHLPVGRSTSFMANFGRTFREAWTLNRVSQQRGR